MLLFALLLLALLAILLFAALVITIIVIRKRTSHIPSPRTDSFFLGHLYEMRKEWLKGHGPEGWGELDKLMLKWHSEVGDVFVVYILTKTLVYTLNPAHIQVIFANTSIGKHKDNTSKFCYLFGERYFGNSLTPTCDYDQWKKIRTPYDKVFDQSFVENILPRFNDCTDSFIKRLQSLADGNTDVSMKWQTYITAFDFISKIIFSFDFSAEWKDRCLDMKHVKESDINKLWDLAVDALAEATVKPLHPSRTGWHERARTILKLMHLLPSEIETYREVARTLRKIAREHIFKRRRALENGQKVPDDMLTRVLKNSYPGDDEELVDIFINFHTGGGEPLASLLSFAVVEINQHSDVLGLLLCEVDEVLGKKSQITIEDLNKLKYTEQVIEETARMHPPANPFSKASPASGVTVGGYFIPPGTSINAPTGVMSHMPQYFEDPDMFKPSRFNPENKRPSPFVYYPFGIGHRLCIGKHFAMIAAKMLIARFFQAYTVALPNGYILEMENRGIRRVIDDIHCTLTPRK